MSTTFQCSTNLAVADAEHVEHIEGHVVAGRLDADELTLMRPRERLQRRDPISFGDLLLDLDREVGEGLPDVLENSRPSALFPDSPGPGVRSMKSSAVSSSPTSNL